MKDISLVNILKAVGTLLTIFIMAGCNGGRSISESDSNLEESLGNEDVIIISNTCTQLDAIPDNWIEQAKNNLHIAYGHT